MAGEPTLSTAISGGGTSIKLYSTDPEQEKPGRKIAKHEIPGASGDHYQDLGSTNRKFRFGGTLVPSELGTLTQLKTWHAAGSGLATGTLYLISMDVTDVAEIGRAHV